MKKAFKTLGIVLLVVAVILLALASVPKFIFQSSLKKKGFSKEEIEMITHLKALEDLTNAYMGKPKVKNNEWSHLTEVYDSDGSTVIGYYIESEAPGYIPRRYYFDLEKNRVAEHNEGSFDEGENKLRELYQQGK